MMGVLPSPIRESGINADALRASEIDRRYKVEQAPIRMGDMVSAGIQGGQAVQSVFDNQDKAKKAEAFQRVLEAGVPAMQEFQTHLPEESVAKRVDVSLFKDKPDVWWKMALEDQAKKTELVKKEKTKGDVATVMDAGGDYETIGKGLVKAGALEAKDFMAGLRPVRTAVRNLGLSAGQEQALENGLAAIKAKEQADGAILPDATRQSILSDYGITAANLGNKSVEAIWKTGTAGLDKDSKQFKQTAENIAKENVVIKKDEIQDKRGQRVIDEVGTFGKENAGLIKVATGLKQVNEALKTSGLKDGLYAKDADIPGIGFGTRLWRDWLNDDDAVNIRIAVRSLMLGIRKENAGSAVTPSEEENLNKTFGLDVKSTGKAFLAAMRAFLDKNQESLKLAELGVSDAAKKRMEDGGVINSGTIAPPPLLARPQDDAGSTNTIHLTGDKAKRLQMLREKAAKGEIK